MRVRTITILALIAPVTALAGQASQSHGDDVSIGVRFGTLGIGGEINKLISSHFGIRVGANFYSLSHTFTESNVTLATTLKLKAVTGLVDFYPGDRGSFHLTGGVITNPVSVTGTGQPASTGTFTINNVTYTAAQVGVLNGAGSWPSASPYLGFGFGTPANSHSGLAFFFDVGAAIGKPSITLSATNPGNIPGLAANVAAQQDTIQTKANKVPVYPAISFGLAIRF
jgi:hypothetical protein